MKLVFLKDDLRVRKSGNHFVVCDPDGNIINAHPRDTNYNNFIGKIKDAINPGKTALASLDSAYKDGTLA